MVEMRVGPAINSLPLISRSLNQEFPVYGALAPRTLGPALQPDSKAWRISASRQKRLFGNLLIFGSLPSRSGRLLERDLGKAPQLARMQSFSFLGLELFQRSKTDLKMLADTVAVEVPGHASQFDLPMQRLVRYA